MFDQFLDPHIGPVEILDSVETTKTLDRRMLRITYDSSVEVEEFGHGEVLQDTRLW